MTNALRLLLLLLMGGSLLAARWTDGLGQRHQVASAALRQLAPAPPVARQAWLPYGSWVVWTRPASLTVRPETRQVPVRAL